MSTLYTITCNYCSRIFTVIARNKKQKFCSRECFKLFNKNHNVLDKCIVCNIDLNRKLQKKFCSNSCSATYNNSIRTTESRLKQKQKLKETLVISGKNRSDPKEKYYAECSFGYWPKSIWENLPGFNLISKLGMFHPTQNPNGVVRDHVVSKNYGWQHSIDPRIISHPANCQIITNTQNIKKGTRSDLSLTLLMEKINNWKE